MDELQAVMGVLLISAIAIAGYFAVSDSLAGAIVQPYQSCCCNILAQSHNDGQTLVRSQIQTFAPNCADACSRYRGQGTVFPQNGLCAENP